MSIADQVFALFEERGNSAYFGEEVSQLEHALQAASHAEQAGAPDTLVVAALLHDVGHLLHDEPEDAADRGIDTHHEFAGERWLRARFGPDVAEAVKLHVDAKRYLCAVAPEYERQLSAASRQSLALQGGPFTGPKAREFMQRPHAPEAVQLRRWDDLAKMPGLPVPGLEHYRDRIEVAASALTCRGAA